MVDKNQIDKEDMERMKEFQEEMLVGMIERHPKYGDSWKTMSNGKLYDRIKHKAIEFDMTFNEKKLISLANLAMLLYIRLKNKPVLKQNKEAML